MLSFSTRLSWITDFTELFKLTDRFYMLWLLSPEFWFFALWSTCISS